MELSTKMFMVYEIAYLMGNKHLDLPKAHRLASNFSDAELNRIYNALIKRN